MKFYRNLSLRILFLFLSFGLCTASAVALKIPSSLNIKEREKVLQILGFGSSTKLLSDPYPLGGYTGLEIGVSFEQIPTEDLGVLGSQISKPQDTYTYSTISIGKGVYNNVDVFVHFLPFSESGGVSEYGAQIRYGFYENKTLPYFSSLIFHMNSTNVENKMISKSIGSDLVLGVRVENFALYVGAGMLGVSGKFVGGASGVTESGLEENESISAFHALIGGVFYYEDLFLAVQVDQYDDSIMSAKVGARF